MIHANFRFGSAVVSTLGALLLAGAVTAPASAEETLEAPESPAMATCPGSGQTVLLDGDLPRFTRKLAGTEPLRIVTIGSSSTAGAGATSPANSYPRQLEVDLLRRFPGHDIEVINVGVNGQEVADMLARLDRDVLSRKPDLVILQFGANGLMRGVPVAAMEKAATTCISRIKAAGADVMLMDLQHAPRIDGVARRDEILAMISRVARETDSALFHRYRLMKAWAARMGDGYAGMVDTDQLHMTDSSYRCMAGALARSVQTAVLRQTLAMRGQGVAAARLRSTPPAPGAGRPSRPASP
jgi:acyl-CoA thioesterase-1